MIYSEDGTEHFDELLNREFFNRNETTQETYQAYLDTDEPTPTLDEVQNVIQKLKDNKAPGIDLIQAELIKKASPDFIEYMYQPKNKNLDH
jgi:Zn-dependent M32 family carboxypeptidase